jgi:hypothetical protein
MKKTLVEKYVENPLHMLLFQQERAVYEVTDLLEEVMRETRVNRTELARRLGKTKGWVTQLLDGEANKTIRTVAGAFAVLGREYHSFQRPIQIGRGRDLAEPGVLRLYPPDAVPPPPDSSRMITSRSEVTAQEG